MGIQYAVLFGLIAMVGTGLSGAFSRRPTREIGSDRALFWRQVAMVALQVPLVILFFPQNISWEGLAEAVIIGLVGYLPIYFFFRAISYGRVGVVSPISNSSAIITTLLAVFILGEPFGPLRLLGLILAVTGVILLSVDFRDWKNSGLWKRESGFPFAVLACLLWGVVLFLFRYPVMLIGPISTSFIIEFMALTLSAFRLFVKQESFALPRGIRVPFLFVGVFGVIGIVAYDFGLLTSAVAVVAIISMMNPVVSATYERFVYGEKLTSRQYVGMALAIFGAIAVSAL
jgi:drug/metabolite transporter (DMT)-like permease